MDVIKNNNKSFSFFESGISVAKLKVTRYPGNNWHARLEVDKAFEEEVLRMCTPEAVACLGIRSISFRQRNVNKKQVVYTGGIKF